jgi:L-ascorbate metabolism protein UlaG (beta-lactamase superfamily)
MQPLYLREDIQVEPLVDQWYAWSHLISPATAARNVTERHLKIMDSYIQSPEIHAAAVTNPRMLGGPFIDYHGQRVDEVRALRDSTKGRAPLIELSRALAALDDLLLSEANGYSLQPLYARLPPPLSGYVELVYDLNNQPSYRLIEALLYRSPYYLPSLQSLMLSITTGDDRPFVLSTPRLEGADRFEWRVPFADASIDELFRLKTSPRPWCDIRDILGCDEVAEPLVRSFFTAEPAPRYVPYRGATARWRYFGHACVLVETASTSLLFDPVLSYTYESSISRYTYSDLPEAIDFVLITHNHQDHILIETLLQIRHKVRHVVVPRSGGTLQDPSLRQMLQQVGFTNVIELHEMEQIRGHDLTITAVPFMGEHCDLAIAGKSAYAVRIGPHSLLFAADSCNIDPAVYAHVHRETGDVDALFLGMECVGAPLTWLYGPLLTRPVEKAMADSRRVNGSDAAQGMRLVEQFHPKEAYVYAMGQEPWLNYVMSLKYTERSRPIVESNRFIETCRQRGIVAERLFGEKEMFLGGTQETV